jgi:hypothetical protein
MAQHSVHSNSSVLSWHTVWISDANAYRRALCDRRCSCAVTAGIVQQDRRSTYKWNISAVLITSTAVMHTCMFEQSMPVHSIAALYSNSGAVMSQQALVINLVVVLKGMVAMLTLLHCC